MLSFFLKVEFGNKYKTFYIGCALLFVLCHMVSGFVDSLLGMHLMKEKRGSSWLFFKLMLFGLSWMVDDILRGIYIPICLWFDYMFYFADRKQTAKSSFCLGDILLVRYSMDVILFVIVWRYIVFVFGVLVDEVFFSAQNMHSTHLSDMLWSLHWILICSLCAM